MPLFVCLILGALQVTLDLFALEDFDHVVGADIFVVFKRHAAFLTRLHFCNLILETLQRFQRAFVDNHVVAQQADTSGTARHTFGDQDNRRLCRRWTL